MRIRPPELETSICDAKYHVYIGREHCDVLSMQIDSDLVIYRTTLVRTFQVVTIVEWISPRSWLYLLVLTTRNVIETLHDWRLTLTRLPTHLGSSGGGIGKRHFTVGGGKYRQSGPRPETGFLRQHALEGLTRSARTDSPRQDWPETIFRRAAAAAAASNDGGAA
ncbi:hypothetical protein F511_37334 [Dorcoceras hygrometricum]|uniref:Uncharacterized protein n=1 Tax=Dorcoceras hygrometricum TaxID=472368 RepID=A0A2Z7C1M9_9LAMI|nr:hypothetical protein F511_37334 [Dorcoceras hygrometricum]